MCCGGVVICLGPTVAPPSRSSSSSSSSSSFSSLPYGCGVNPRPPRPNRVTRCGVLAISKLVSQLKAGGRRSWRAVARAGHFKSRCSAVRSASTPLWGVSWMGVGRGGACLEPEQSSEGGRAVRSELSGERGGWFDGEALVGGVLGCPVQHLLLETFACNQHLTKPLLLLRQWDTKYKITHSHPSSCYPCKRVVRF